MLKTLVVILFVVCTSYADNKILGQPLDTLGSATYGGTFLADRYAKIAREIIHNSSKISFFLKNISDSH